MSDNRIERLLAFMVAAIIGVSILCFIVMLIAGLAGAELRGGVWPVVVLIPYIGLPIGFLLLVGLLIVSGLRRRREAQDAER